MSTQLRITKKAIQQQSFTPVYTGLLQRKCACGGSPGVDGECAECRAKRLSLQRSAPNPSTPSTVPPIVHDVLNSPGHSLDAGTRSFMEPRFRHSFTNVRVHTDARAAKSAKAVNALAYTVGKDVVFGAGQYAPDTSMGRKLLAHELTHVVQQKSGAKGIEVVGSSGGPYEREAEENASATLAGQTANITTRAEVPTLQRQKDDFKLKKPTLALPHKPKKSLFPQGEKPQLHLFHLEEPELERSTKPRSASLIQLTLPPPLVKGITREQIQEALKQPLPDTVSVSGAGAKAGKQRFFEPLAREKVEFGLDLSTDSNINFQISAVARHLDAFRFKLRGKIPLDIIHEPTWNIGVSLNPKDIGTAAAQLSVTALNFHLIQYAKDKDFIELALGQYGIGFDSKGNFIMPAGAQLELHSRSEHVSIFLNTGGQLKVHGGKATWEWQPITFGLLIHWMNP